MKLDPHYTNERLAALYDLDSPWGEDTDFYIALAGEKSIQVTDVGCGTGTLACGLKAAGHKVVGVDPAMAMLSIARAKPLGAHIQWQNAAAKAFALEAPCDLITMTGHAFQVLLTDDEIFDALTNFHTNLKVGGRLAFESRNPDLNWNEIWGRSATWGLDGERVEQVRSGFSRQGEYVKFKHTFTFSDTTLVSESELRFASVQRIEKLMASAGFRLLKLYGDWRGSEFSSRCEEMIFVAEKI